MAESNVASSRRNRFKVKRVDTTDNNSDGDLDDRDDAEIYVST